MSDPAVRVVSLQASNILRLSAVDFAWKSDAAVLTLGGKNGAGKSSVINAVAMALGGMALCPDEPLKRGEQRGFVELNLDELIVRREFWRDLLSEQPAEGPPVYGETKSRLVVKNKEGVKQEPAQRLLDRLVGKMTFDPTAFVFEDEKRQAEILRKIVSLDVSDFDEAHQIAYERRAVYTKQYKDKLILLEAMTRYENVPDVELTLDEHLTELKKADELRTRAAEALAVVGRQERDLEIMKRDAAAHHKQVSELTDELLRVQERLTSARAKVVEVEEHVTRQMQAVIAVQQAAQAASEAVPDTSAIQQKIAEVEDTNSKIRANTARANVLREVASLQKQAEEQDIAVNNAVDSKAAALRAIKFPVDGLGINHEGCVTFNNIAFKQSSTAEQIRVSVAIGFALHPTLKLLCVKNGNALDEDSFKLIADAAKNAGGQVLMEIVTKDAGDVSVFIEDGHTA